MRQRAAQPSPPGTPRAGAGADTDAGTAPPPAEGDDAAESIVHMQHKFISSATSIVAFTHASLVARSGILRETVFVCMVAFGMVAYAIPRVQRAQGSGIFNMHADTVSFVLRAVRGYILVLGISLLTHTRLVRDPSAWIDGSLVGRIGASLDIVFTVVALLLVVPALLMRALHPPPAPPAAQQDARACERAGL